MTTLLHNHTSPETAYLVNDSFIKFNETMILAIVNPDEFVDTRKNVTWHIIYLK